MQYTLQGIVKFILDKIKSTNNGVMFFLQGDLGVGKTYLVREVAKYLKIKDKITSPTFLILKDYQIPGDSRLLVHVDFYRFLDSFDQSVLDQIGFFDYAGNDVVFIEWPEIVQSHLPEDLVKQAVKIKITKDEWGNRIYQVE